MGMTTRYLLDCLMDQYGNIAAANLKPNEARINKALDNSRPIRKKINKPMMQCSMRMMGKTSLQQNKSYKQHFAPPMQPVCTDRRARNGDRNPTPKKHGQISNSTLQPSITRYANNSVYRARQDSTVPTSPTKPYIWQRHLTIFPS